VVDESWGACLVFMVGVVVFMVDVVVDGVLVGGVLVRSLLVCWGNLKVGLVRDGS
jgi:hypothetical protein